MASVDLKITELYECFTIRKLFLYFSAGDIARLSFGLKHVGAIRKKKKELLCGVVHT